MPFPIKKHRPDRKRLQAKGTCIEMIVQQQVLAASFAKNTKNRNSSGTTLLFLRNAWQTFV